MRRLWHLIRVRHVHAPGHIAMKERRNDRIVPDWLGWLALAVALALAALVLYFKLA